MSDIKRREFLKRAATTAGGTAVGAGLPAAIIFPNLSQLAKVCPVNTYLKQTIPQGAIELPWSAAATERLARVPAGFMRDVASMQGARLAFERGEAEVSVKSLEDAIARATAWMNHAAGSR